MNPIVIMNSNDHIRPLSKRHAREAARLHLTIEPSFLSLFGPAFLRQIYAAIPSCPSGFGYVWEEPGSTIQGFIACAESIGPLYKQALLRRGFLMALTMVRHLVRPKMLKETLQTLFYPSHVDENLPPAEIVSIAVDTNARGKGIGKALLKSAFGEFRRRGIRNIKVGVSELNRAANVFYERCGFRYATTMQHHGLPLNIYTIHLEEGDV
jgi:ribosomal protein S18 acetylase RimI-like enzyme